MKKRKILLSMLTVAATGAVVATTVTSCGVSSDILNNMVDRGGGDKFSTNVTFDQAIKTALTNKDATDAFKKSVVNKIFFNWFKKLSDRTDTDKWSKLWKQYQTAIDDSWDSQVQSYKDNHSTNWQYYFQNEVLNPVGGFKGKTDGTTDNSWYQSQWEDKARTYFTGEMTKYDYLAVPTLTQTDPSLFQTNPTYQFPETNLDLDVATSINTASGYLGTGPLYDSAPVDAHLLNPDWWPAINFYATANPSYDKGSKFYQDRSYALLQREAFESYTDTNRPMSTGMLLWKYTLPKGKTDLKSIYNEEVVNGKDGDSGLLDKASYSFPYFGETGTENWGPNEEFAKFTTNFKDESNNFFLNNRGDVTNDTPAAYDFQSGKVAPGSVGLINIPINDQYGDDSSDVFLLKQSTSINDAFETFAGPVFDLYHAGNGTVKVDGNDEIMPDRSTLSYASVSESREHMFDNDSNILSNFLYAPAGSAIADLNVLKPLPYANTDNGVKDLAATFGTKYESLFNDKSDFYHDEAQYIVNGVRLGIPATTAGSIDGVQLPYIMIRNDSGVHIEGIDGAGYLQQLGSSADPTTSKWRPGDPWSQERENQILKFRTIYETKATPAISGTGIGLISQGADAATGELITYLTSNTDSLVLDAVNDVLNPLTTDGLPNPFYDATYKSNDLFGLADFNDISTNKDWNIKLNDLIQSFDLLNQFQTIVTNYDTNNKKLLAWSDKYIANSLYNPSDTNIDAKYNNGLAMTLPLEVIGGQAADLTGVGKFDARAKTHFQVAADCVTDLFKTLEKEYPSFDKASSTLPSMVANVNTNYDAWVSSIPSTSKPSREGKGNLKGEYKDGKYSENILSYNPHVNALLNAFGSSSSFSNSEKTAALNNYIYDVNPIDYSSYQSAIASLFLTKQLLASTSISSLLNSDAAGTALPEFTDYQTALTNEWKYQLGMTMGSFGTGVTNGYSDQLISYDMLLASIKYLSGGDNPFDNFLAEMKNKITAPDSTSWNNNAYIVWLTKNSPNGDPDFAKGDWSDANVDLDVNTNTAINGAEALYGWKSNYDNIFSQEYSQPNAITTGDIGVSSSYKAFDEYSQFAGMPISGATDLDFSFFDAMGYLGLQTSSSLNSTIKDALETQYPSSSTKDEHELLRGSLYNFTVKDGLGATDKLGSITAMQNIVDGLRSSSQIMSFAAYLNTRTNDFADVISQLTYMTDTTLQKTTLKEAIEDKINASPQWLDGYNVKQARKSSGAYTPTLELRNPTSADSPIFRDTSTSDPAGYRARIMQLNSTDFASVGALKDALGDSSTDLFNSLVVQTALEWQNTGSLYNNVMKAVLTAVAAYGSDGKATVFDRRFNDQLGSSWVKDYKSKN